MRIYIIYLLFVLSISFKLIKCNDDISFVIYDTTPSRLSDFGENIPDFKLGDVVSGSLNSNGKPQWNYAKYPGSIKDKSGKTIIQGKESFDQWFKPTLGKTYPIISTMKPKKSVYEKYDCQYTLNNPIDHKGFDNRTEYPGSSINKLVASASHNYYYSIHMKFNVEILKDATGKVNPKIESSLYNDIMIYIDGKLGFQMFYSGTAYGISYNLLQIKPNAKAGEIFQVDVFLTQRKVPLPENSEFTISFSNLRIYCPSTDSVGVCLGDNSLIPCYGQYCKEMIDGMCYDSTNCSNETTTTTISTAQTLSSGITTSNIIKPSYKCQYDSCPYNYNCIQLDKSYTCVSCWFSDNCSPHLLQLFY